MPPATEPPEFRWPRLWLRRADQAAVAGVIAAALAAMAGHWIYHGGHRGRMIEVDSVRPGAVTFTVDINQADWPELTVLPGIGEKMAKRIVDHRQSRGPYADLDELRQVPGIGPRTLERITPYLRPIPDLESTAEQSAIPAQPPGS